MSWLVDWACSMIERVALLKELLKYCRMRSESALCVCVCIQGVACRLGMQQAGGLTQDKSHQRKTRTLPTTRAHEGRGLYSVLHTRMHTHIHTHTHPSLHTHTHTHTHTHNRWAVTQMCLGWGHVSCGFCLGAPQQPRPSWGKVVRGASRTLWKSYRLN